jgi:ankyrin repeat protein
MDSTEVDHRLTRQNCCALLSCGPSLALSQLKGHAARVSKQDSLGYAVFSGDLPRVTLLLAEGADPDEPWGSGTSLLQVVDEPSEFFDENALGIAVALLDAGASVNASDENGLRPVHAATRAGRNALRLLVERGADVNVRTMTDGNTPLHFAVDYENVAGVELLLSSGADRTITNNDGLTALDVAKLAESKSSSEELVRIVELLT